MVFMQSLLPLLKPFIEASVEKVLLRPFVAAINSYLFNYNGDVVSGNLVFDQRYGALEVKDQGIGIPISGLATGNILRTSKYTVPGVNFSNNSLNYILDIEVFR